MKVVGLTGTMASGKGVVADILKKNGYEYFILSSAVIEEAKKRGIEITRENLVSIGNQLREEQGKGVLAKLILEKIKSSDKEKFIVDSIKNPGEADFFREALSDFFLIGVDAPQELRLKRALERAKEGDPKTIDELKAAEEKDREIGINSCLEKADYLIQNDRDMQHLSIEVSKILEKIDYKRPSWDEYFMQQARSIASRATCDRGRSGAIMVKNKRVIATDMLVLQ